MVTSRHRAAQKISFAIGRLSKEATPAAETLTCTDPKTHTSAQIVFYVDLVYMRLDSVVLRRKLALGLVHATRDFRIRGRRSLIPRQPLDWASGVCSRIPQADDYALAPA
jgi:hypothetical protein